MRLLLGSGGFSTPERQSVWRSELDQFLGPIRKVLFVPYALKDHDGYVAKMTERGFNADRELIGLHRAADPKKAILEADAIYVGGGNSFRLLNDLYRLDLCAVVRERVLAGMPYIGVSAGTNMSCPTLMTTNDMPIVQPPSFQALDLIPFQINPHYFAGAIHYASESGLIPYGGETRDDRIREYHEMNSLPVLGLFEGCVLRVPTAGRYELAPGAGQGARLFRAGQAAEDYLPGAVLPISAVSK